MLTSYITTVHLPKLRNQHQYNITNSTTKFILRRILVRYYVDSPQPGFVWWLLLIRLKLWILETHPIKMKCPVLCVISGDTWYQSDLLLVIINLDRLVLVVGFHHFKVTNFHFPYFSLIRSDKSSPYSRGGELSSTL